MKSFDEVYKDFHYILDPNYKEIGKLHDMLDNSGIPHEYYRLFDGWQIVYPNRKEPVMDAIEHYASYGSECDTMEISGLLKPEEEERDVVAGNLSAEDVFYRIQDHYMEAYDEEE